MGKRRSKAENKAIRDRMQLMQSEGFETPQATAIAFRYFRDGQLETQIASVPRLKGKTLQQQQQISQTAISGRKEYSLSQDQGLQRLRDLKRLQIRKQRAKKKKK